MQKPPICYQMINPSIKYLWVIEGDIKGCFDNINHKILLKLIRKRISDRKTTGLIRKFLNAGYSENGSIYKPEIGTPQGGVLSPLLANIYLHELDAWWQKDHTEYKRRKRRITGRGNYILSRYADDFIMLSNDTKKGVKETKQRLTEFLREQLELDLSEDKTLITHATAGFDFLGFHIRKFKSRKGVIIRPSSDNIQNMIDFHTKSLSL